MLAVLRSDWNGKHSTFSLVHGTLHPIHANPLEVIVLLSLYLAVLDDQSKEEQFIDVFTFLEISFQKQKSAEESSRKKREESSADFVYRVGSFSAVSFSSAKNISTFF